MAAQASLSQMNVRLDRSLKTAGDKALMEQGITPTEFVRTLWEKIARSPADLRQIEEAIGAMSAENALIAPDASEKLMAMRRGRALFKDGLLALGISPEAASHDGNSSEANTCTDAYAEALIERMREKGTW